MADGIINRFVNEFEMTKHVDWTPLQVQNIVCYKTKDKNQMHSIKKNLSIDK